MGRGVALRTHRRWRTAPTALPSPLPPLPPLVVLYRLERREGVNLEYLKNVMVQYLSCQDSSQKATLERVLATLLQFSPNENKEIKESRTVYNYFFSPTKQMKPPLAGGPVPMMPLSP